MVLLRRIYGRLRLTVNETNSAVARIFCRKFLGYRFWVAPGSAIRAARSSFNIGSTASSSRWWHNGAILLNAVLTLKWLDTL